MFVSGTRYFVLFKCKQTLAAILIMLPDIVNSLDRFYRLPGPDNTGLCYTTACSGFIYTQVLNKCMLDNVAFVRSDQYGAVTIAIGEIYDPGQ